ncbi:MAG: hypothetical protein JST75_09325 [Bacteroidetes bacterium]|nr:hypothetical protein [Bacteroidota bacterium]
MEIPGLSTQAFKPNYDQNRKRFNGIEYDSAFGFNMDEAFYRDYDPQIGRFLQIDPSPNQPESPYASMSNNPVLHSDPLGDTLDLPINDPVFSKQFKAAVDLLISRGRGENVQYLQQSQEHINVYKQVGLREGDSYSSNVIFWNPRGAYHTSVGVSLSPAAALDHEFDHAAFDLKLKQMAPAAGIYSQVILAMRAILLTPDGSSYENKEEKRVETGSEQKTALALGLIKKGQVTRSDHNMGYYYLTSGPTTIDDFAEHIIKKQLEKFQHYKKPKEQ